MPNKDKTGPRGERPKTGRQEGNCEGVQPLKRGYGKGVCRRSQNRRN
ncbi:MAG: DUF5320 family protein [Nanoarchaeota archaeon]|nr:DUF5320 family protein [Nanoarchaeota archaeon]